MLSLLLTCALVSDPLGDSGPLTPHDPWGRESFEAMVAVTDAHRIGGILVVGVADRHVGGGLPHCRVLSGWRGLPDGEYVVAGGVVIPVRWLWPQL